MKTLIHKSALPLLIAALSAASISCSGAPRRQSSMSARDGETSSAASASRPGVAATTGAEPASAPALTPGSEATEASLRGADFAQSEELETAHFDYDSSSLKDDALAALKKNADYLKRHSELEFLVAGHCDDRGTIEYNLALGQRRAKEVRDYYVRLGVPAKSLATISYGKESPLCQQSNETCWAQNRRAETKVRSRGAGK